ncbi:hypothetical protein B0H10DRAFT_1951931 [Mycena sp. CBHHK59/15]|nr:hypothetical protein B0H10DRAFT_1951931 [Mycena sp. CBHHK59/15]
MTHEEGPRLSSVASTCRVQVIHFSVLLAVHLLQVRFTVQSWLARFSESQSTNKIPDASGYYSDSEDEYIPSSPNASLIVGPQTNRWDNKDDFVLRMTLHALKLHSTNYTHFAVVSPSGPLSINLNGTGAIPAMVCKSRHTGTGRLLQAWATALKEFASHLNSAMHWNYPVHVAKENDGMISRLMATHLHPPSHDLVDAAVLPLDALRAHGPAISVQLDSSATSLVCLLLLDCSFLELLCDFNARGRWFSHHSL